VHSSAVNDIDLQHDKLVAASAGEDGQVHIISLADLKTRSTLGKSEHIR
jgi:WD40 repeat protein